MEATKKTTTTRAALLVVAALSMLLSGLFVASASQSDATPPPACPDGFNLTADEKNCFQNAVVTTADNPNTCPEGQITPDGTKCYEPARVIPQEGATYCPTGYSPDNSLGGMCARFEPAPQNSPTCPDGSRGVPGGCYILVAKGPAGAQTCATGSLQGSQCVITGAAPTQGPGSCPTSSTVFLSSSGVCYSVVQPETSTSCAAGYVSVGTICKAANQEAPGSDAHNNYSCPSAPVTPTIDYSTAIASKILECYYTPTPVPSGCPASADLGLQGNQCWRSVALTAGGLTCEAGFGLVGTQCVRYETPAVAQASCPIGSVEDASGSCRKPVADAAGSYYCASADAALNGTSCVYTTGFLVEPAQTLYKCDRGVRAVVGSGSAALGDGSTLQVICWLGDADTNISEGPSCLQGVLSSDGLYCIVDRIDAAPAAAAAAAPAQAFTG